jgi:hypothetical protein
VNKHYCRWRPVVLGFMMSQCPVMDVSDGHGHDFAGAVAVASQTQWTELLGAV